ncbi:acylneuraminate cytidylyltransferase [Fusobacterium sp.]|uniref:acylneuraminate cytidylyltransferase n=1 Tax=Fusobacterium sp. TaxID=68766 RepID=UPI0025BB0F61|nr:acylneuraminate cytidylyltransferase [Fusobacterium sp.]
MRKIAIIPLRAGSKGIPGKNKKKLLGRPLFSWTLGEAILSKLDEIYVFTDDTDIINYVQLNYNWTNKVKIMERSEESATDTVSTEYGMVELAKKLNYNFDILCLLQATSPLTTRDDINRCLAKIEEEKYDSSLTVVNTMRFIWKESGESINYNYNSRPRRQDFEGLLVENGAVYTITREQFEKTGVRIGGKIAIVKMPEDTLTEIDEKEDWVIMEKLIENRLSKLKKGNTKIQLLVLDVDGVFTNGNVDTGEKVELSKSFSLIDGMGIEIAREEGLEIIVMTSENSDIVSTRMNKLKIETYLGIKDKYSFLEKIREDKKLNRNQIAYLGDDINDLANICSVKWGITPNNGTLENKIKSDLILNNKGGNGAIREAINFILKYNKNI